MVVLWGLMVINGGLMVINGEKNSSLLVGQVGCLRTGKSPFLQCKSTISMDIFNSYVKLQRVVHLKYNIL